VYSLINILGSIIWSDEWAAYRGLAQLGYVHQTVNHSIQYVNPANGVHTNNIESRWNAAKAKFKRMFGVHREFIPEYLDEHVWRCGRPDDCYLLDFIDVINRRYPL